MISTHRATMVCIGAVLVAYVASSNTLPLAVRIGLGVLAVLAVLPWPEPRVSQGLWLGIAAALGVACVPWRYVLANHHFVLTYAALILGLGSTERLDKAASDASVSLAACLGLVMGFAVAHKLASPSFLSGEYFSYLWATGSLGTPVSWLCDAGTAATANESSIATWVREPPSAALPLQRVCGVSPPGRWLALLALLCELWLACVYLLAPRHRAATWSLAAFGLGLVFLREELVFAALLCAMAFGACDSKWKRERMALALLVGSFAAAAVLRAWSLL